MQIFLPLIFILWVIPKEILTFNAFVVHFSTFTPKPNIFKWHMKAVITFFIQSIFLGWCWTLPWGDVKRRKRCRIWASKKNPLDAVVFPHVQFLFLKTYLMFEVMFTTFYMWYKHVKPYIPDFLKNYWFVFTGHNGSVQHGTGF